MGLLRKFSQGGSYATNAMPGNRLPEPVPEPTQQEPELAVVKEPTREALIAQGLVFKGIMTGDGSLYIDGEIVGNIDLPESRVTVGPHGAVSDGLSVCIRAREIVVKGRVRGNISASDLVEIHAEGSLTGNVSARRISIADGAFFKGDINLHAGTAKPVASARRVESDERKAIYA